MKREVLVGPRKEGLLQDNSWKRLNLGQSPLQVLQSRPRLKGLLPKAWEVGSLPKSLDGYSLCQYIDHIRL
jgi:hypothetical protein